MPEPTAADVAAPPAVRHGAGPADHAPLPLDAAAPARQSWSSVEALTVDLTGDARRTYYLMSTARTRDIVAHWRQGPFVVLDETITLQVELPAEVTASVAQLGAGHLMVHVASTTTDGRPFPRESVGQTVLAWEGGQVVGLPRHRWSEAAPEHALTGVDDAALVDRETP